MNGANQRADIGVTSHQILDALLKLFSCGSNTDNRKFIIQYRFVLEEYPKAVLKRSALTETNATIGLDFKQDDYGISS